MISWKLAFFPIWMTICWTESVLMWAYINDNETERGWGLTEDNTDKSENNKLTDNQETEVSRNYSSIELRARQSSHKLRRI